MSWLLFAILVYVAVQLLIGALVSRNIQDESDYLVGGRKLGMGISTMTIFATWFGAETCIGSSGAIYENGLAGGRADPFGYALCIIVMGIFFAALFWRRNLMTIADLFRTRFGAEAEKIAVLLMVPTSLLWAAAQIRAFGQILAASSDLEVSVAISIAATVVILYTMMGGLLADAMTDLLQGVVLIAGLIVTVIAIFVNDEAREALSSAFTPERLSLVAPGESIFSTAESWAVPVFGSLFAQELVSRTLAAKTPQIARRACFLAGALYLVIGLIPVLIGLAGPALVPGLEHSEQLMPRIAHTYLPGFMYVVFAGALISAFLSTVDSNLLACSGLTSHNFIAPLMGNHQDAFLLRLARVLVVVFGVLAYLMAQYAEGVYSLVEEASAFGSSGLFVVIVLGLVTRRGGPVTACATLITGVGSYVTVAHVLPRFGTDISFPFLISLAASAICYLAFMAFEDGPAPAELVSSPTGAVID
jgi:SSS family transporter